MRLLSDERREDNALFFHPRESGLSAKVTPGRFAAVQQPQDRPGNFPEGLRQGGEGGVDESQEKMTCKTVSAAKESKSKSHGAAKDSQKQAYLRTIQYNTPL